jgi:hypothetical protein
MLAAEFQPMKKVLHEKWIKVGSKCDILNHFEGSCFQVL